MFFDFNLQGNQYLASKAADLGYQGVLLVTSSEKPSLEFTECSSLNIYKGIEIKAKNPEELRKKIRKFRPKYDVILIHGGDVKINRAAVENPQVDVLCHPYKGRRDSGINHVLSKKAQENNVAIELSLKYLLKSRKNLRHRVFSQYRQLTRLQRKYKFPLLTTTGAKNQYELCNPLDLISLAECFGLDHQKAMESISKTPLDIINRIHSQKNHICAGVELVSSGRKM